MKLVLQTTIHYVYLSFCPVCPYGTDQTYNGLRPTQTPDHGTYGVTQATAEQEQ